MSNNKKAKVLQLLALYFKVTAGALVAYFALWEIAAFLDRRLYVEGKLVAARNVYIGPVVWLSIMACVVGTAWVMTEDLTGIESDSKIRWFLASRKVNRSCLVAFPFLALGTLIGKSSDSVDHIISVMSGIFAILVLCRMVFRELFLKLIE